MHVHVACAYYTARTSVPLSKHASVPIGKPRNEALKEEVKNDIRRRVSAPFVDWQEVVGCEDDAHKGELRPRGQPVHRPSGRGRGAALRPSPSHKTTMFHGTGRPRTHTSTFTATNLAIAGLARTGGIRAVVRAPHRRADEGGPALGRVRANLAFAKFVAVNVDVWVLGLPHGRRREQPIAEAAVQCHGEYPLGVEVERPRRRRWTQRCAKTWPHCTVASLAAAMAAPRRACFQPHFCSRCEGHWYQRAYHHGTHPAARSRRFERCAGF